LAREDDITFWHFIDGSLITVILNENSITQSRFCKNVVFTD